MREILGRTAKLSFHRVWSRHTSGGRLPAGYEMLPASNGDGAYPVERQPMLQGDRLADAAAGFDHRTGQPIVTFRFDTAGAGGSPKSPARMSASPSPSCSTARC